MLHPLTRQPNFFLQSFSFVVGGGKSKSLKPKGFKFHVVFRPSRAHTSYLYYYFEVFFSKCIKVPSYFEFLCCRKPFPRLSFHSFKYRLLQKNQYNFLQTETLEFVNKQYIPSSYILIKESTNAQPICIKSPSCFFSYYFSLALKTPTQEGALSYYYLKV